MQKNKSSRRHVSSLLILSLSLSLAANAWGKEGAEVRAAKAGSEQHERNVDQAARQAQENAISRLAALAKKYAGTRQEPIFLAKLGDLQLQLASIVFRISHGATAKGKSLDMGRYNAVLNQAIRTFGTLIAKYPNYPEIVTAYYSRGKAYEELGNETGAKKDYLHVTREFPESDEAVSAYMSLAEYAITANDHALAVKYLKEVEKKPESPHYPFALYKLAWSYYNLKDIPKALSYGERQIAYYNERGAASPAKGEDGLGSDYALKENTLLDMTVFYFAGFEEKLPQYPSANALAYFKKIEGGPALGKMFVRYAKQLRAHNHEDELGALKDQVLSGESDRPEALDVLLTAYEFQQNKRSYPALVESAQDMIKLHKKHTKYEGFAKAQKMLLETCDGMQTMIVKNKAAADSTEMKEMSGTLAKLYDSFVKLVDDSDLRIPRVHYNLAETLFTIKDYPGATEHYRWIVDHGKWDAKVKVVPNDPNAPKSTKGALGHALTGDEGTVADASLKAIAARYEVLHAKKLIPTDLAARPISKDTDSKLEPELSQWISWVDTHVDHAKNPEALKAIENFVFESNRALYAQNHLKEAIDRFQKFPKKFEKSAYSIPSASLVLDTYIASADWEKVNDLATNFLKMPEFKTGEFAQRLYLAAADASYKLLEVKYAAKDYAKSIDMAEDFLKKYPKSPRLADALSLAGAAALAKNDKKLASAYFSRLIAEVPRTGNAKSIGAALMARAALAEERYEFLLAASDYKLYLTLAAEGVKIDDGQADKLRRKTLALSWLSGDPMELKAALDNKSLCTEALAAECDKYNALLILGNPATARDESVTEKAFDRAHTGRSETKPLWAAVALEGSKHLAFRDRNKMLRALASGWGDLDPMIRYALLPYVSVSAPKAFQTNRNSMGAVAPLRANERYIADRVDRIREMENAATALMKMPWARIRAEVLNENASLYIDMARGLQALPAPKGIGDAERAAYDDTIRKITMPFEEKGQDMRAKAFEIASRNAIEEVSFSGIADPFFQENPSQAKKLKPAKTFDGAPAIDLAYLSAVDPASHWPTLIEPSAKVPDEAAAYLKSRWAKAVQARNWPQIAFFMNEAKDRRVLAPGVLGVVKAVSFATAGARAEALAELEDSRKELVAPETQTWVTTSLMRHYLRSMAKDKTKSLMKSLPADKLTSEQSTLAEVALAYVDPEAAAAAKAAAEAARMPAGAKGAAAQPTKKQ